MTAVVVARGEGPFIAVGSGGPGVAVKEETQELAARHGTTAEPRALAARFDMIPVPACAET